MLTFKQILEPKYFQYFRCTASDCQDSCCIGWDVVIDKETYDAYRKCQDTVLKPLFQEHIILNASTVGNYAYVPHSRIKMKDYHCPFLNDTRHCLIQKTLGEEALSITCDSYPRTYNNFDEVLERSLSVSCPEAARLVLLNEKPMEFISREEIATVRNTQIPVLNSADLEKVDKPYAFFNEIRAFIIAVLQDRTYPVWQRLLILSMFCSRLEQVSAENYETDIHYLLSYFKDKILKGVFREPLNNPYKEVDTQLQAMKILVDFRMRGEMINDKFLACVNEFNQGLGFSEGASPDLVRKRYENAYKEYFMPFMEKHEYIMENYLVNYVFKNLFPLGPQISLFLDQRSIFTEFSLLVLHYSMIKTLLIGTAAYYRKDFNSEHVIRLIQTFAKAIEHNKPYLNQAMQFINASNINNIGGMTILIKN